ncbi:hypothetical protein bthur0005_22540 [Bacillus thuringiensis serovar pakistani str. T13001]|nr:hypothetical protein bcere0011_22570 [Bacillus cereus m1550]EEM47872.1 hypothetical protein bthur0005_22540 [Bacillus thuringiensis serovar pakistani str. T13001]
MIGFIGCMYIHLYRENEVFHMKYSYKVFIFIWTIILLFFLLYYGYSTISDKEQMPVITIKQ